jgi:hypothetical protein
VNIHCSNERTFIYIDENLLVHLALFYKADCPKRPFSKMRFSQCLFETQFEARLTPSKLIALGFEQARQVIDMQLSVIVSQKPFS